jgi:glycosyltransferase involved in cell wall biosynthesis
MSTVGVVAIGRNEGERLLKCFDSLSAYLPENTPIAYVDSGSTDGSCEAAKERGIHVIDLDMTVPFTAARARNAGWHFLVENHPDLKYIQFLDGDCQIVDSWISKALDFLETKSDYAIACGRRCEIYPNASPYNLLADMEWNTPVGDADACGGDALIRIEALKDVDGYNPKLICGEEPEMCIRLKRKNWKIYRMEADMTNHDAAMTKFSQFWKRAVRAGWSVGEGFALYGKEPEQYMKRENFSGWLWGLIIPAIAIIFAPISEGFSLLLFLGHGYLFYRIYRYRVNYGDSKSNSSLYAKYCVISKFPQLWGQIKYLRNRMTGKAATLIEYKN